MSSSLVNDRMKRIKGMRNRAETFTLGDLKNSGEGYLDKDKFLAGFLVETGVSEKLALEYYRLLVNSGIFEEKSENEFRSRDAVYNFEKEKKSASVTVKNEAVA